MLIHDELEGNLELKHITLMNVRMLVESMVGPRHTMCLMKLGILILDARVG